MRYFKLYFNMLNGTKKYLYININPSCRTLFDQSQVIRAHGVVEREEDERMLFVYDRICFDDLLLGD